MAILDDAGRLFGSGNPAAGIALIERAAAAGDTEALYALANWRLYGLNGPHDVVVARQLLATAAAAGHTDSIRLDARLLAAGIGGPTDEAAARRQLNRLAADPEIAAELDLADQPAPAVRRELLADDPAIVVLRDFVSAAECAWLMARAAPRLQPSSVVEPGSGRRLPHPHRTSLGTNFGPAHEDMVVRRINRRIAAASGTDVAAGEPLHILAYTAGQEYRLHHDALPGAANQRSHTLLIWLNDGYAGGETEFPAVGIRIRGRAGDALLFGNLGPDGRGDPRMQHAGLPPVSGRKWLATRWIRQRPVSPFG